MACSVDKEELLRAAFADESPLRKASKAKAESVTQKAPLALNDEARSVAELMIHNLCEKCSIFAAYRRATTINIGILR